jgi:hypothetical protein
MLERFIQDLITMIGKNELPIVEGGYLENLKRAIGPNGGRSRKRLSKGGSKRGGTDDNSKMVPPIPTYLKNWTPSQSEDAYARLQEEIVLNDKLKTKPETSQMQEANLRQTSRSIMASFSQRGRILNRVKRTSQKI